MGSPNWPASWGNPPEQKILNALKHVTILIRIGKGAKDRKRRLYALDLNGVDIYKTNIYSLVDIKWHPEEVKGLKVRFAYPGKIRAGAGYAGFFDCRIEDIFGNIDLGDLPKGSYVEVMEWPLRVDCDDVLGRYWHATIIVYDKEETDGKP